MGAKQSSRESISGDLARSIVETLHEPLLVLSPELNVTAASPAFFEHFEVAQAETIGRSIYDLGNGQWNIPALRTLLESVLPRDNVFYDFEVQHTFESIGHRVMLLNARQLEDAHLILLGIRDITDANAAQRALRDGRQRLAGLFASAKVGISEISVDGRFVNANDELCRIIGRSRAELLGLTIRDVTHPDDLPHTLELVGQLFDTGQPVSIDKRYVRAGGASIYANSTASLLEDGDPPTMVMVTIDLTERRRAEAAMRSSEARLHALVAATSDVVFRMSPDWTRMRRLEVAGYLEDATSDQPWLERYIPHQEQEAILEAIERAKKSGEVFELEHRAMGSDGTVGWMHSRAVPVTDDTGRIVEWFGAATDITARKEAERGLRLSERRFRMIADNMAQLAWTCDELGTVTWYNRRWLEYTGLTFEEMRDWGWTKAHHPDHIDRVVQSVTRSRESGEVWEDTFPLRGKDGQYRWFLSRAYPIHDEQGRVVQWFGTNTDITELRETEQAMRLSEQRYRLLVESAREYAMLMIDPDGTVRSWNIGAERLFGYTAHEMIGQPSETLYTDEDRIAGAAKRKRERAVAEGQASTDQWYRRKDGSLFWANGVLRPLEDGHHRGFIKILRDQTRQKAHEEQLKTVMAELNHRVKNTLAVVQSIASQTMRRARNLDSFRPDFERRLRSIAKAHNLLTRTSWTGVTLGRVIESEVGAAPGDVRISSKGPGVTLPPEMTLALHMVLHELTTNAHKYGGLADDEGSLSIEWTVEGDRPDRALQLTWREHCPAPITEPNADGFGTRLIEQLIVYELKGEIDRTFQRDGLHVRLRVPLNQRPHVLKLDEPDPAADTNPVQTPATAATADRPAVLLVEDLAPLALALKVELEHRGYMVIGPAPTVAQARDLVRQHTPAVAVLDVNLGDEQVFPLIPTLDAAGVPVILLTGLEPSGLPEEVRHLPVLAKPVELDDLDRLIREHAVQPGG